MPSMVHPSHRANNCCSPPHAMTWSDGLVRHSSVSGEPFRTDRTCSKDMESWEIMGNTNIILLAHVGGERGRSTSSQDTSKGPGAHTRDDSHCSRVASASVI
jgi:hypothetical protein